MDSEPRNPSGLFWRAWWRSLSVKRPQALVAVLALGVGASVAAMLLNLYSSVHRKMTEEFRAYGANVLVAPAARPEASTLADAGLVEKLAALSQGGTQFQAVPVLYAVVRLRRVPVDPRLPEFENAVAVGADFRALETLNPAWRVPRPEARQAAEQSEVVIGARVAQEMKLGAGDTLSLEPSSAANQSSRSTQFHVQAVVSTGAPEDDQVFVPLDRLQSLAGLAGKVSLIELSVPGSTAEIEGTLDRLRANLGGFDVRPVREIVYSSGHVLDAIRWLLISLSALILVIIALSVTATMTAIALERRKDIAVMKALGARDGLVIRLFLAEGVALGLAGGVAGFIAGCMLAREASLRLFEVALRLDWRTLPAVLVGSALVSGLATLGPARMVSRVQPATVLKGE